MLIALQSWYNLFLLHAIVCECAPMRHFIHSSYIAMVQSFFKKRELFSLPFPLFAHSIDALTSSFCSFCSVSVNPFQTQAFLCVYTICVYCLLFSSLQYVFFLSFSKMFFFFVNVQDAWKFRMRQGLATDKKHSLCSLEIQTFLYFSISKTKFFVWLDEEKSWKKRQHRLWRRQQRKYSEQKYSRQQLNCEIIKTWFLLFLSCSFCLLSPFAHNASEMCIVKIMANASKWKSVENSNEIYAAAPSPTHKKRKLNAKEMYMAEWMKKLKLFSMLIFRMQIMLSS